LVKSLQQHENALFFQTAAEHFDASGVRKKEPKSKVHKALH